MIFRTTSPHDIIPVMEPYADELVGFDPYQWLENKTNIALVNEKGDVSLFEDAGNGLYNGHMFYFSRGREAVKSAKEALESIFKYDEVEVIRGLTPIEKLGARWLAKNVGFKSYGEVNTVAGPCELFILTKKEKEKHG